jgi:hypothetical protein
MKTMIFAAMALMVMATWASAAQAEGVRKATPHFTPWCKVSHPVAGCLVRPHGLKRNT